MDRRRTARWAAVVLAAGLALPAGCGKKAPPFLPVGSGERLFEYATAAPGRGGVIVSWKELPSLPKAPTGRWDRYLLARTGPAEEKAEIWSTPLEGKGGKRYEYLDLTAREGVDYVYLVRLETDNRKAAAVSEPLTARAGEGPPAPGAPSAEPGDGRVALSWEGAPAEAPGGGTVLGYNVFRRGRGEEADPRRPLNPQPLPAPSYLDMTAANGAAYCYSVTLLVTRQGRLEESALSPETCAEPADRTPPAAPSGLAAAREEGGVRLTWSPGREADLAGYRVYRRRGEDEPFAPLTGSILKEPQYTDVTAAAGRAHYYAVTAVDSSPQANESPWSEVLRVDLP